MRTVSIAADVWCDYHGDYPIYRIYVDNDLLTERTFIWSPKNQYIREHIEVNLYSGEHWITVETSMTAKFRLANVQVDGQHVQVRPNNIEAKFII